jgi:hypothetical protein
MSRWAARRLTLFLTAPAVVPPVAAPTIDVLGAAGVAILPPPGGGGGVGGVPYEGRERRVFSPLERERIRLACAHLRHVPCRREVDGEGGGSRPAEISDTGNADFRLNPAPELTTVSQKTVPVRQHRVLAPEECTRALPPAIVQPGALQKSNTAMRATRARTQSAGASVAQITTQNWPDAKVTNLTAGTDGLKL